jgi:hypothetical protein
MLFANPMFIKTKERAGRSCFFLCITEQGGDAGRKAKVIEYSVCLGETLHLSKKQWLEILMGSKSFRLVPLEDVLAVVQEYVKKHGYRADTAAGIRDAARSGPRSDRSTSSGRKSQTDDYAAALELLGLPPGSSDDDVESAFRKWARRHHPDAGGDPSKFRALVAARRLLLGRVTYT